MRILVSRRALAVIGTVIGLLAGAILGAVFQSSIRGLTVLLIVVVTLTMLSLVLFAAVVAVLSQVQADHSRDVMRAVSEVDRELAVLRDSLGQTVEYQVIDELNHRIRSTMEDPVTRAVLSARSEILVLDIVDGSGERPAHAMSDNLAREFLDVLMKHVEDTANVEYHRICQMEDPREQLPTASAHYYRHLIAICRHRVNHDYRFSLKAANVRYPFKFMLIDRRILMLQLSRYDRTTRHAREAWSEVLFSDAEPALVTAFYDMWRDVEADRHTRNLAENDVAETKSLPPAA
jgi:hypothetical protein